MRGGDERGRRKGGGKKDGRSCKCMLAHTWEPGVRIGDLGV